MRTIILPLIIAACLLLTGCGGGGGSSGGSSSPKPLLNTTADGGGDGSGGGGDGNNGGGGGNGNGSNGDGGDERPSLPAEVELSISPFIDGLRIQWHNLSAIEEAGGIYIHLNLTDNTTSSQPIRERIVIEDLTDNSSEIDGLDNGIAYHLVEVRVELADNTFWVIDNITWSEPWEAKTNALDNNGNGIVVGANHDGDGRADGVDEDDDNDGRPNSMDHCRLGEIGWLSADSMLDYDSDGCRDDEDWDNDNDGVNNTRADGTTVWDLCRQGELGWRSNSTSDHDGDGCRDKGTANNGYGEDDDDDNDMVLDKDEIDPRCVLNEDCDGDGTLDNDDTDNDNDGVDDSDEVRGCVLKSDCDSDTEPDNVDIDDDGDGLIEIRNVSELDAVRWVLDGTGFKATETAMLDQIGCGNGVDVTVCNGYELVKDISLTDYIANNYATAGWQPIAHDMDSANNQCDGDKFTAIFDGNGFSVNGLWIDRPQQDCVGLFGIVNGTIRNLGVVADRIIGDFFIGILIGGGFSAKIISSYGVGGRLSGRATIGGLVGIGESIEIVRSYVIVRSVVSNNRFVAGSLVDGWYIGGILGHGEPATIIQSYAVSGEVRGDHGVGGLMGHGGDANIAQSYAVSGKVSGGSAIGGLAGTNFHNTITHFYVVSGKVSGDNRVGGLIGEEGADANASYWDTETSGRTNSLAGSGQTSDVLRMPTGYTDIYTTWDDGLMVDAINDNATIWCDEDGSGMIEDEERRDDSHPNGDNRIWDFGTSSDYPALRCTGDSLTDQRAWWYLNTTSHKPQLNQTRLDAYLAGTLP